MLTKEQTERLSEIRKELDALFDEVRSIVYEIDSDVQFIYQTQTTGNWGYDEAVEIQIGWSSSTQECAQFYDGDWESSSDLC